MQGLIEGRIVHYILDASSKWQLEHRPAIVTKVWDKEAGTVNLMVFVDGSNDYDWENLNGGMLWATSVTPDLEGNTPGTWHWIEPA